MKGLVRVQRFIGRGARGLRELALLVLLWIGYTVVRATAGTDVDAANGSALKILGLERTLHMNIEQSLDHWAAGVRGVEVVASFWYASLHLVVTGSVLLWLYLRHPDAYRPLRRALVIATGVALVCYLALPTAPPRLLPGYVDILQHTADVGWWPGAGGKGSVPTNELAAFPSMHAGWSLWVGLALFVAARRPAMRWIGACYALGTAAVVVLTGNHWILDVVVGWVAVAVPAVWLLRRAALPTDRSGEPREHEERVPTPRAAVGSDGTVGPAGFEPATSAV
ncbi:phosphatase PAP2 family protein [Cellulomonas sp. P5_E12]